MPEVLLGLGSNIEPEKNCPLAIKELRKRFVFRGMSRFYSSPPVGFSSQPDFVNGSVLIETSIPLRELKFEHLRAVEKQLGRKRSKNKNAPRTIDIDILLYGTEEKKEDGIAVPDPDLLRYPYLLIPSREVAPHLIIPPLSLCLRDALPPEGDTRLTPFSFQALSAT